MECTEIVYELYFQIKHIDKNDCRVIKYLRQIQRYATIHDALKSFRYSRGHCEDPNQGRTPDSCRRYYDLDDNQSYSQLGVLKTRKDSQF